MSQTTIIVPCHNEARRLQAAKLQRFAADHANVSFLMVNDGSSDETFAMLEQLATVQPDRFAVLNLAKNAGKAEAVRQGFLESARSQLDYIGFWDADLATPLDSIPLFSAVLDRRPEIAVVMGARLPLAGHEIRRKPLRAALGKIFLRAAAFALGSRFSDTQCGAKLFRATPEVLAAFSRPFDSRWIFDVELLARLRQLRRDSAQPLLRQFVYELPLDAWEDVAGSRLKRSDFVKAVAELTAIWWRYCRPGAPQYLQAPIAFSPINCPLSNESSMDSSIESPRRAA